MSENAAAVPGALSGLFALLTSADRCGVRKPAAVLRLTRGHIGVVPLEAVHADPVLGMKGANEARMRAVHVSGGDRWRVAQLAAAARLARHSVSPCAA